MTGQYLRGAIFFLNVNLPGKKLKAQKSEPFYFIKRSLT